MKKKPARKAKSVPEYDSQRQQNVLLEKIYAEVKTIGEGHSGLNRGIDRIEDRLGGVDQRLDLIDAKLIQVDSRFEQIDSRFVQIDNKFAEHDKCFDRIEMVVTENRKDIKVLKTGQEELKADVKRLEHKLDTNIANHEQRIQNLESLR